MIGGCFCITSQIRKLFSILKWTTWSPKVGSITKPRNVLPKSISFSTFIARLHSSGKVSQRQNAHFSHADASVYGAMLPVIKL